MLCSLISVINRRSLLSSRLRLTCCYRVDTTIKSRAASSNPNDEPIKFSTSDASQWKARQTFINQNRRPKFEPIIVSLSLATFLIYFCMLREENDIDEMFDRDLFYHVPKLEEQQLRLTLEYQKMHGQDTSAVETRLAEIEGRAAVERPNS